MRCRQIILAAAKSFVLVGSLAIAAAPAIVSAEDYDTKAETCGGIAGKACPEGKFCENAPGMCQGADIQGTCVGVPRVCPRIFMPVCGCDGKTYGNDCERQAAKVSKDHDGKCS